MGTAERFPPIPHEAWVDTKETLHRFAQADGRRPDRHHRLRLGGLVLSGGQRGSSLARDRRRHRQTSPVHHFWHTFDIAVTRFSDRQGDQPSDHDPVTREAYSREVVSAGFWFGDEAFREPAFYSYTAPEPEGLAGVVLVPEAARWVKSEAVTSPSCATATCARPTIPASGCKSSWRARSRPVPGWRLGT